MEYCRYAFIKNDSWELDDAEVFVVYKEDNTWAFAMRINDTFTLTRFQSDKTDKDGIRKAMKQIKFCKTYGWSYTGGKSWNTATDDTENEFVCLYCKTTTFNISKPCLCREKKQDDMFVKSPSGIMLPV